MIVFLVAPLVIKRYKLPGIIGIIIVGAIIGPNGFGLLERDATIELLGEVGLIYLMFLAGLEINLNQFLDNKDRSIVFGLISFLIPQTLGTIVGIYILDLSVPAALLFAAIFSSHTLLAYPIVQRLGIVKNEAMTATIGGTILTDTLALLVLAVVIASVGEGLTTGFFVELSIGLSIFFIGTWLIVPKIGRWFFRTHDDESYYEFLFVMAILFTSAFFAEMAGVEHIIGAFIAGLALNRLILETGPLMNRIEFVGNALFIPFFLLSVGMLVDVWVITEGLDTIVIAGSLIALVITTKLVSSWITGKIYSYNKTEMLGMFGLSVGQAAAALAIVLIGYDAGVPGFDQEMVNAVVLMILVVSVLSPSIVEKAGISLVKEAEEREYDPTKIPRRILIPIAQDSRYKEQLLDLAFAISDERSKEPINTVSVIRPNTGNKTLSEVAKAEEIQKEIEEYAAGAEEKIKSHTRVNHNIASGIVRSTIENQISTLIIGWDGAKTRNQMMYGNIIDQVLNRTTQLTMVTRLSKPIETYKKILLTLPPNIEYNEGFAEAIETVKKISEKTGCQIKIFTINSNPTKIKEKIDKIEPETPIEVEKIVGWRKLMPTLKKEMNTNNLIINISSRRDKPGWNPELKTLPNRTFTLTQGNSITIYPGEKEREKRIKLME
ncbi:Kef-type K(+) transport system membrane component, fusion to UspA family protein [Methanonatronarchaeum thermophilum]|uniref:Kef-type K(+) transport system membrane component, fusion to UspA family protein n=1 Tax=Methanonatronarchaeum thermophilum TaxID=1927129 RepID=A0A1Y3GFT0_9EURY|nr:cation:proton antiporter [Methanonatronarchaeum thermophilum]OUJ19054.1 Kef-type K(+) transport system membrane component, fusion to UspA family protein [Methanonatronarchaeum thermophilum]